jgi:hypothetical protein
MWVLAAGPVDDAVEAARNRTHLRRPRPVLKGPLLRAWAPARMLLDRL